VLEISGRSVLFDPVGIRQQVCRELELLLNEEQNLRPTQGQRHQSPW
jgi:hypothetical protein